MCFLCYGIVEKSTVLIFRFFLANMYVQNIFFLCEKMNSSFNHAQENSALCICIDSILGKLVFRCFKLISMISSAHENFFVGEGLC